jgi:hypothetical protein
LRAGSHTTNVLPAPGVENTATLPPCDSVIGRTIARPSPERRSRAPAAPRQSRSNTRGWSWADGRLIAMETDPDGELPEVVRLLQGGVYLGAAD